MSNTTKKHINSRIRELGYDFQYSGRQHKYFLKKIKDMGETKIQLISLLNYHHYDYEFI